MSIDVSNLEKTLNHEYLIIPDRSDQGRWVEKGVESEGLSFKIYRVTDEILNRPENPANQIASLVVANRNAPIEDRKLANRRNEENGNIIPFFNSSRKGITPDCFERVTEVIQELAKVVFQISILNRETILSKLGQFSHP